MMRRWSWLSFVVGLLVAAAAVGIPWAFYASGEARDAAYTACLERHGFYGAPLVSDDELAQLAEASADCL